MTESARWRFLDTLPAPGAWNMAVDVALMESVRAGSPPILRFYRWSPPCLSLGRNQPAQGRYDTAALRERGWEAVRRPTGGRAVLHDRELTYSAVVWENRLGGPRATYSAINEALVAGLQRLGVRAELQPRGSVRAPVPSLDPCFGEPVEGEVVAGGRKLVGSAQMRERGILLQHGSLLLADDQAPVHELLRRSEPGAAAAADEAPACLADFLTPLPTWSTLVQALVGGWNERFGASVQTDELSAAERQGAELHAAHFADPGWTWRF